VHPSSTPASVDSAAAVSRIGETFIVFYLPVYLYQYKYVKMVLFADFDFNDELKQFIRQAQMNFEAALEPLDLAYMQYTKRNKNDIKKLKLSPDSFMQLAFQVGSLRIC
jgi:hypothetical protein